jgi:hypothetical protein
METRAIVVKNIEVLDAPPGGGGRPGGGPGGPGPLERLRRLAVRVLLVALVLAVAIPAVVVGGACVVVAIVAGILLWAIRRLTGGRGAPVVTLTGVRRVPPGPSAP